MVYVEFPTDQIVNVHWKKKTGDGGGTGPPVQSECNGPYGYGYEVVSGGGLERPYGPYVMEPMGVGFLMDGKTPAAPGATNVGPGAISAVHIVGGDLLFTTRQLIQLAGSDPNNWGPTGKWGEYYDYRMIYGREILGYTFSFEWNTTTHFVFAPDVPLFGLGLSHVPTTPDEGSIPSGPIEPTTPFVTWPANGDANTLGAGAFSYYYDYKYFSPPTFITPGNWHDPSIGGDAWFFWMTSTNSGSSWSQASDYSPSYWDVNFPAYGDHYTWTITPHCGNILDGFI